MKLSECLRRSWPFPVSFPCTWLLALASYAVLIIIFYLSVWIDMVTHHDERLLESGDVKLPSVQFSRSVMTDCDPMGCSTPGFLSITNSWSLPKLMSIESVMPSRHLILRHPFSSCLQSFLASGSFSMSQFFPSGQRIGVSASTSVLPMNIQDWFPLGWTGWISLHWRDSEESSPTSQFKSSNSLVLSFLYAPTL